jgi:MoxR-like ATPase
MGEFIPHIYFDGIIGPSMPGRTRSPNPNDILLDSLGRYVKDHNGRASKPIEVELKEPLPSKVRFYLSNTSFVSEGHGYSPNVRPDKTDNDGNPITNRDDEYLVIVGGYNHEYDVFTFLDDSVYSHYGDPHKSYIKEEALQKSREAGIGFHKRTNMRERADRGGETVVIVTPDHINDGVQIRERLLWIRDQLNEEDKLSTSWSENQLRAQRFEHVIYEFLSNTNRRESHKARRNKAINQVANWQGVKDDTIKESFRADIYTEESDDGYLAGHLDAILQEIEQQYFEAYDLWKEPIVFDDIDGIPEQVGLHFPPDESRSQTVLEQIDTALRSGDHIILTGPPGSGKSDLSEKVCEYYPSSYHMSTANDDWSTFDTIGGYRPQKDGNLEFHPGLFLQRFMEEESGRREGIRAKNEWLIIDELNRANIDKAFGSLFSALTGNNITLPFDKLIEQEDEEYREPIRLVGNPGVVREPRVNNHTYYIPDDWRIIATINSVDKSSVYRMSRAFMRRFAFIKVPVPSAQDLQSEGKDLLEAYVETWDLNYPDSGDIDNIEGEVKGRLTTDMANIWYAVQQYKRIGPGIIKDVVEQAITGAERTGKLQYEYAVVAKLLPQLDGLPPNQMEDILRIMDERASEWFKRELADEFVQEYLDIDIETDGE